MEDRLRADSEVESLWLKALVIRGRVQGGRMCNADALASPAKLIVAASRDYLARDPFANESTHVLDLQDAIALFEAGEPRQAADLLEKLTAEMPGYATARVLLARTYERMNDWEPALKAWREAHQIIPNSPVVRRGLQRAARKAASRSPIEHARQAAPSQQPSWEHVRDFDEEPDAPPSVVEDAPEHEAEAEPEAPRPGDRGYEDLDRLISELESARIVPRPDLDSVPAPDLEDDIEDVVSETLARIYASQGQYEEAAHVYDMLAEQQPEKAEQFNEQASELRSRASEEE